MLKHPAVDKKRRATPPLHGPLGVRYGRIIFDDLPAKLDAAAMERIYAGCPAEDRGAEPPPMGVRQSKPQAQPS